MKYLITLFLVLISCENNSQAKIEKETNEILKLEAAQRAYHFGKDAESFVNLFSDNFLSINKGAISLPTKDEKLKRFGSYFKSVDFIKWDNKQEPVVRFSDDASIAYLAVDKEVIVSYKTGSVTTFTDTTHFAWLSIYKKIKGEWKIDCVTSTNKSK